MIFTQRAYCGFGRSWLERLEARQLFSTVTWTSAVGGTWNTPSAWSSHAIPKAGDDVVINQPGNIQITLSGSVTVNSLAITGDALVLQTGAVLTTTGAVTNSGTITVNAAARLVAGGAYTESAGATLSLPGGGSTADPLSNQFSNTDFEAPVINTNGTTFPGNWSHWGSSYLSKQYAYIGLQSLQTSGANSGVLQNFSVTPGASYTLSSYAMTPAADPLTGTEEGSLQLIFLTSNGTQISTYSPPNAVQELSSSSQPGGPQVGSVGSVGWNHFTTTAVAPANAASVNAILAVGAYNGSGPGGGSVYWDAPKFGPAAPGPSKVSAASILNSGIISVGPTNTIIAGTFTQTSTATLDIQIGGSPSSGNYGFVTSSGMASFAGTLESEFVYGYIPSTTDVFTPIEYPNESGSFANDALAGSTACQFQSAVTFTNVLLAGEPTTAFTTTVNAASDTRPVNTNLLGTNIAWWYGDATTAQTQQMAEQAGLTTYRFPGGSTSDDFHFNIPNNYGDAYAVTMPQFAQFIEALNGTAMLTLDYGSGSPQEAAANMAYLVGSPTDSTIIGTGIEWNDSTNAWQTVNWGTVSQWAALRSASPLAVDDGKNFLRINHPTPFANIKYCEIGNEEYGSWEIDHHGTAGPGGVGTGAQHDPATYAAFAKSFGMYAAEILASAGLPNVAIGIDSGDPTGATDNNWTKNVLTAGAAIGFVPNYISDHSYMQGPGDENDSFLLNDTVSNASSPFDWSARYAEYQALLQQTVPAQASSVATMATEFNSVYTNPGKQSTSLVSGLFVADSLGSLLDSGYSGGIVWDLRNGWDTTQNNSQALYGWRNGGDYGLIGDAAYNQLPATGAYVPYPSYFAEQLASKIVLAGGEVESVATNYEDFHAYAVKEANGHLELLVINTNPAASLNENFQLTGFQPAATAQFWQYGIAQDAAQSKSATGSSVLTNFSDTLSLTGSNFSYTFPAYSMTVIDLAPAPATPILTASEIGDGSTQRSIVTSLQVKFNTPVNFDTSSFTLFREPVDASGNLDVTGANGDAIDVSSDLSASNPSGDEMTWIISTTSGTSLANGIYQLVLHGAAITAVAGTAQFNAGSDQIVAFDSVEAQQSGTTNPDGQTSNYFHVLYGDINGDGFVDGLDLRYFKVAFGSSDNAGSGPADDNWSAGFDFNGDGFIDGLDLRYFKFALGSSYFY